MPIPIPESVTRTLKVPPGGSGDVSHRPVQRCSPFESKTGPPWTSETRHSGSKPSSDSSGTTVTLTTSPGAALNPISSGPATRSRTTVSPQAISGAASARLPIATTRTASSHEQRRKLIGVTKFGAERDRARRARDRGG